MIIDIHTHVFPDELAVRAVAALSANAGGHPAYSDGTCAGLRAALGRTGVDRAVIAPIATKPSQVRIINAWAAEMARAYPELIAFGTLHPAQDDWAEEIDRLVADGLPGVKMHHDYQQCFVDADQLLPIYRALAAHERVVLFHAGVDIGLPPPVHCPPERLARVLDAVPELTVIAAHMGGYACWDAVEAHLLGRDLYLDTSYALASLDPARMAAMIRRHGAHRVLFGSDSPWSDQGVAMAEIRRLGFNAEDTAAILGENARRLLHLPLAN
ncbi:MAG TPA: amidohydrolase family protein [Armatimonadota bacterium]|jgi:hypothetical protein